MSSLSPGSSEKITKFVAINNHELVVQLLEEHVSGFVGVRSKPENVGSIQLQIK
jgi:hypothetical protein